MNYLRALRLLVLAAAAVMSFAGLASANPVTSPKGTVYTGTIKAESEGGTALHGSFISVSCNKSTVEGKVESHSGTTAGGNISLLNFTECNYPVKVLKAGSLQVHTTEKGKGTLTSTGAEITIETSVGNCTFSTSSTDIGTITGTGSTNGAATLDIDSSSIPRTGHSFFCGSSGEWTGSYKVTSPSTLYIGSGEEPAGSPLTSPLKTPYTSTLKAESEGSISLDGEFTTVSCKKSSLEGKVESHNSTSATGNLSALTFGECNYPVKVLETGSLVIHTNPAEKDKGIVTSKGALITIDTSVATCLFQTWNTEIGTIKGSTITKGNATIDASGTIPRIGHSFFCGSSGTLTGSYKVTTPSELFVGHPEEHSTTTVLTSPKGTPFTGTIKAESEGTTSLHGSFVSVSCGKSAVEGKVESHTATTASVKLSSTTFTECNFPVKVLKLGSLEIHSVGKGNGTLTSTGAEITIETSVGSCNFTTFATDIGTVTGTAVTGTNATLDIGSSAIPRTGHSFFCGSSGTWTGAYKVTSPSTLYID
jgi:hypothetical protein